MRRLRRKLQHENPAAATQLAELIPERLSKFAVVGGYTPVGGEIDPRPAMRRLADAGARLALPVVRATRDGFDFHAWRDGDPLDPDGLGVPAPLPTSEMLRPELILAPLLAFDRLGGRLGQGGGYFDRVIAELRAEGPLFVMGLAYAGQEEAQIPCEPHDARLDAVLTEAGYFEIG